MLSNINLTQNISSNNKLVCPNCYISNEMNSAIINFNRNNPVEFEKIKCKKCYF